MEVREILLCSVEIWGGILCVLASSFNIIIRRGNRLTSSTSIIAVQHCCAVMIAGDVVDFLFQGEEGRLAYFLVSLGYFLSFSLAYVCFILFIRYLSYFIEIDEKSRRMILVIHTFAGLGVVLIFVNVFWHGLYYIDAASNTYQRGPFFILFQAVSIIPFLLLAYFVIYNWKRFGRYKTFVFLSYIVFPMVTLCLQMAHYTRVSMLNIGITMSVAFMTAVLFVDQQNNIVEQREELVRKEEELLAQQRKIGEMQVRLVISQIQPHFLYNALNTIYYMCDKDVEKAKEAINDFSHYLRGNMDALRKTEPVSFDVELNHVQNYLELEKMRYEDELQVEYDIETREFFLPALSLQPLVENAVKHGVGKKDGGGTVTIRTRKLSDAFEVIVEDDGVGYDTEKEVQSESRSHIGIDSVRERLQKMVGGTLNIRSREGEGTVAVIDIPM